MITIANANALHIPLSDKSVQCVVTSPPYWGLRDYGTAKWEGGSEECDHKIDRSAGIASSTLQGGKKTTNHQQEGNYTICPRCGARRIDAQIGLEATPAEYVAHIVAVMRECWRVLKDDGTCWLNLGDSYAMSSMRGKDSAFNGLIDQSKQGIVGISKSIPPGLKPKDLCGIPWRVAFALQDDGWYLRSDIIWAKPNPMPESVTDRPTKAHEYVFLLTKQARYYYDAEAIKEDSVDPIGSAKRYEAPFFVGDKHESGGYSVNGAKHTAGMKEFNGSRNRRSVWTVATQPYSGAHFATFPPALIEPMILAGTSARGECPRCGKAWVRVVEDSPEYAAVKARMIGQTHEDISKELERGKQQSWGKDKARVTAEVITIGWRPQCACPPHDPIPQTVLDPFGGSGTTGQVAVKHGRKAVLLDLNTKYIDLQFDRVDGVQMVMPT